MNTRKILTYYGMFGCWGKFIPGFVGTITHGIWFGMILFWIFVNAGGIILYFSNRLSVAKNAKKEITPEMTRMWYVYNLMALFSFIACGELWTALTFLLTSVFFMWLTEKEIAK